MSSVFVTGAAGYIGQNVAIAFRNAGFRVYGLVRTPEKGTELIRHEVIPVVGDLNKAETYIEILGRCAIVVDTVADLFSQAEDPCAVNRILLDACTRESDPSSGKVKTTFIYTSGVLAYTHSDEVRDKNTPATSDFPFVKARRRFEQDLLSHTEVRGIVIRPGFVYGGATGNGNHLIGFFANGEKEVITINNQLKDKRWNWVHVQDLADAYVRAAKNSHSVAGEIFNIVSESSPTVGQLTLATARVAGFKGKVEFSDEPLDYRGTFRNKTVLLTNKKARNLLGWSPRHLGVLEELDIFYHTIKGISS